MNDKSNLHILLGLIGVLVLAIGLLIAVAAHYFTHRESISEKVSSPKVQTVAQNPELIEMERQFASLEEEFKELDEKYAQKSNEKMPPVPAEFVLQKKLELLFGKFFTDTQSNRLAHDVAQQANPKMIREFVKVYTQRWTPQEKERIEPILRKAQEIYKQYEQLTFTPERANCFKTHALHKDNFTPYSAKGSPLQSIKDIECPDIIGGVVLTHVSCQEAKFEDGTKSILYFSDNILEARDDFDTNPEKATARYLFRLRNKPTYYNGQCHPSHSSETIVNQSELFSEEHTKRTAFVYDSYGRPYLLSQTDYNKPETITISFDEQGRFKDYLNIDNQSSIVNFGNTKIELKLDNTTNKEGTYTLSVLHNGPGAKPEITKGTWKELSDLTVQLDNGKQYPSVYHWELAKTYCQIYPKECKTGAISQTTAMQTAIAPSSNNSLTKQKSLTEAKPDRYLHSINDILGRQGQAVVSRKEIACTEDVRGKLGNRSNCQEIIFDDGSKSIISTVKFNTEPVLQIRQDFDANGQPIVLHEFGMSPFQDSNHHFVLYPVGPISGIIYNSRPMRPEEAFKILSDPSKNEYAPGMENAYKKPKGAQGPRYCDLYPKECRAD